LSNHIFKTRLFIFLLYGLDLITLFGCPYKQLGLLMSQRKNIRKYYFTAIFLSDHSTKNRKAKSEPAAAVRLIPKVFTVSRLGAFCIWPSLPRVLYTNNVGDLD